MRPRNAWTRTGYSALVVWVGLYPLLQLATIALVPRLDGLPGPVRTAVVSALLVGLLTYMVTPVLQRLLARWL